MHAQIGHKLTEIRDYSQKFVIFSLTIGIKRPYPCFGDISSSSKNHVPCIAAVVLILQLECRKQLLI